MMLPSAPPSTMPSAAWSIRFLSRPIQIATPTAIAVVSPTSIQRPRGLVALSRPSEMPSFRVKVKLKIGSSTSWSPISLTPSGCVTTHFASWSSANTRSATRKPRRYLAIQHRLAPLVELAVRSHVRHVPPAASALVVCRLRHPDLIALVDCRRDEQLGEQGRVLGARDCHLGFEAGADDLVAPQRLDRFGDLCAKLAELRPPRF